MKKSKYRFVVLQHRQPAAQIDVERRRFLSDGRLDPSANEDVHFDLMLETSSELLTWALATIPDRSGDWPAIALPMHRVEYLEYEGPVSDGRGDVTRMMAGDYELVSPDEVSFFDCSFGTAEILLTPQNILIRLQRQTGDRFRLHVSDEPPQASA